MVSARKLKMGHHWVFQLDNDPKCAKIYTKLVQQSQTLAISVPRPQPDQKPVGRAKEESA